MEEKKELNDIILDKNNNANGNKKVFLAIATLGVILIVVVMLMNTLSSKGTDNLPQAVLPPEPQITSYANNEDEPLFEDVEVLEDTSTNDESLNNIAQKLKEESQAEVEEIEEPIVKTAKVKTVKKVVEKKPVKKIAKKATSAYYIQVGSFSKYAPNKKFLKSITDRGFKYKYHKVRRGSKTINKVLVGPFSNESDAKKARIEIRSNIEAGAFLIKL